MSWDGNNASVDAATQQLANLFMERQEAPISREEILELAPQDDPMKRLRRNGGARDILDEAGVALFWGGRDKALIYELGLPPISRRHFISYTPKSVEELSLIRSRGHAPLGSPDTLK